MSEQIETHPIQKSDCPAKVPKVVTMLAYEVYYHMHGKQDALVTGRGGFGAGELIGYLYARSFPKAQWSVRAHEAWDGMERL